MQIPVELDEKDISRVRYVLDAIRTKLVTETDDQLIMMALNRFYVDIVEPEELDGDDVLTMPGLAETPEMVENRRKGLLDLFATAGISGEIHGRKETLQH